LAVKCLKLQSHYVCVYHNIRHLRTTVTSRSTHSITNHYT